MTQAQTRARVRSARAPGVTRRAKQHNARPTLWDVGEFVAVDGEGFSDGEPIDMVVGQNSTRYFGKGHSYAYLSASDGSAIYSDTRLGLGACLSLLFGILENNRHSILVAFGASYDVCHMLCHDLSRDELKRLLGQGDPRSRGGRKVLFTADGYDYLMEYRPRKCFTVQRWTEGARRWTLDKNGKRKASPHLTMRLWDVWGFFQDSFIGVLEKWCPGDPDFEMVRRMKGDRNIFERHELEAIKTYNAAELRLLVKVMNRVRDAINDLGLKITRWDGAGAIAAAMMTKQRVKDHKGELPNDVFEAARRAYSGGHIEACKVGYYRGAVHHYDLNSAYPREFRDLPSLSAGEWRSGSGVPPDGYSIVSVEWSFPDGLPFYPLFYRCSDGTILYPARGSGWYWHNEFHVAQEYSKRIAGSIFTVRGWHHFEPASSERPFGWVADYYERRQFYIETAKNNGTTSGPEKIIKLGLNSLYGKTAQQVGARWDLETDTLRLPPFFQLDWAGYVTAGCRAKLMAAALQKPHAVIGFATDGLFTTEPLDLYTPAAKELGAWEYKVHDGITVVMPGVYWLHDGQTSQHYSRGFDKREMSDAAFVHDAWRSKRETAPVTIRRLIGLGSACTSAAYWDMRGCFMESKRSLCLTGDNSKRYPINLARERPHLGLVDTIPREHTLANLFGWEIPESAPYPVAWLDGTGAFDPDLQDELEMMDAALA